MSTPPANSLIHEEAEHFRQQGYLGPLQLCSESEMAAIRAHIDEHVLTSKEHPAPSRLHCRHLDDRVIYDLCAHPAILSRMANLIGPDLMIWSSNFWLKEAGGLEIPWHQDAGYWNLEPPLNLSAWIAIDEVTAENSCVQIIPGSHRTVAPSVPSHEGTSFAKKADPEFVDTSKAVKMELRPGEFFLFNERMLHYSSANHSNRRRLGVAPRITAPFVKVYNDRSPLFAGHSCIMVSGEDRFGLNRLSHPPPGASRSQENKTTS
ncbi:MAG: phytanoyl-CoA dioxygenase family protein [Planctomycetota bacterium]|nr:phytanoyl-CoA dioxygenase family protein [Planctomycetota bacterium]MDA1142782.1 phytanoyl-CoA dioxygenase family protein [Planctomycetota bacterium]